jgi:hypothetical protein
LTLKALRTEKSEIEDLEPRLKIIENINKKKSLKIIENINKKKSS